MTASSVPAGRLPSGRLQGALFVAFAMLGGLAGIAATQGRLADVAHTAKERDDVWLLPPPAELKAATLGYTAAATDILWAKLLVEYGVHMSEHRSFPDLNLYLDAILELEPDFAPLYAYVDTMLVYRPGTGTETDARNARRYLERGLTARPLDYHVWLQYGQFIAFLAPSFLSADADKEAWRREGAEALMHAVELGAEADRSLAVAGMLHRWGKIDAAKRHLRQVYALADDERTRADILQHLRALDQSDEQEAAAQAVESIESERMQQLPFLRRGEFLLLGPVDDPLGCVGLDRSGTPACAHRWDDALQEGR